MPDGPRRRPIPGTPAERSRRPPGVGDLGIPQACSNGLGRIPVAVRQLQAFFQVVGGGEDGPVGFFHFHGHLGPQ
jgi:hypothetical protein